MATDASNEGWGATVNGVSQQGLWNATQHRWHINRKEMWVVKQVRPDYLGREDTPPAIGQQLHGVLSQQTGNDQIPVSTPDCHKYSLLGRIKRYPHRGLPPAREVQPRARLPQSSRTDSPRVASASPLCSAILEPVGEANKGPVCLQAVKTGIPLRQLQHSRTARERSPLRGCVQPPMEPGTGDLVGVSPSLPGAKGPESSPTGFRKVLPCPPPVGLRLVDLPGLPPDSRASVARSRPPPVAGGSANQQTATKSRRSAVAGVADLFTAQHNPHLDPVSRRRYANSWKKRTRDSYFQQWQVWVKFCRDNTFPPHSPREENVTLFLNFLCDTKGLAYKTVEAYKSCVVRFSHPPQKQILESSEDIRRVLKGMKYDIPPVKAPPVWDKDFVMDQLERFGPTRSSPYELGRHLALLILLVGGRRVSDLLLLHTGAGEMLQTLRDQRPHRVIFQPRFGSKTDWKGRSSFIQGKMGFRRNPSWSLSIPDVLRQYLLVTKEWREESSALFLSVRKDHHGPVSIGVLRGWIKSLLIKAGVKESAASAGSTRAAAATGDALRGHSLKSILKNGNWANKQNFVQFYFRPASL